MMPVLQVGPVALQLPGLLLIVGIYLGLWLAERYSWRYNVTPNHLYNLTFIAFISGIIGARLAFVLHYPEIFANNLLNIFSFNYTLLDPLAGISTAILGAMIYGQKKGLAFWSTLDAITPVLAVFTVGLGLAHIASGNAFGAVTELPWGIELWGENRHPSQVYETSAAILILILLYPAHNWINHLPKGSYLLTFTMLTSLSVLLLRIAQVIALFVLMLSLFALKKIASHSEIITND